MLFRKVAFAALSCVFLLPAFVMTAGQLIYWGRQQPQPSDELCVSISRKRYPLRHWAWSGIFPVEGGFIPDPHFVWSERMRSPEVVHRVLGHGSEYQVVDVNTAFDDRSSEILLLIIDGMPHEFTLAYPRGESVQAILATPMLPQLRLFVNGDEIVALASFFGPGKGMYIVPRPLARARNLDRIPVGSAAFEKIAQEFRTAGARAGVKSQFCDTRRNDFIAFYEKYCGPCGSERRSSAEIDARYAEFWLK